MEVRTLYKTDRDEIRMEAQQILAALLERVSLATVHQMTGISRTTLYKWADKGAKTIGSRDAAWLVLIANTDPKIKKVLRRKVNQ